VLGARFIVNFQCCIEFPACIELRFKLATSAAFVSALVSNRILMPIFDRGQGSNYASSKKK
jgi:hypothetical protein